MTIFENSSKELMFLYTTFRHTDIIQILRDAVEWFSIKSNGSIIHMSLPLSTQHEDYFMRLFIIKTDWENG